MKAFKIYRIVCTITETALVSGSDLPHNHLQRPGRRPQWYDRGQWSHSSGAFWKGEETVRKHIHNLCHDWERRWEKDAFGKWDRTWCEPIISSPCWERLQHLCVEQFLITDYSVIKLAASDFMGIAENRAA